MALFLMVWTFPAASVRLPSPNNICMLLGHWDSTREFSFIRIFRAFSAPIIRTVGFPRMWVLNTFPWYSRRLSKNFLPCKSLYVYLVELITWDCKMTINIITCNILFTFLIPTPDRKSEICRTVSSENVFIWDTLCNLYQGREEQFFVHRKTYLYINTWL